MSPEGCVTGSCAGPSVGPSFVIRAARVQFDPGGPKFVTTRASRTPVSAPPQLDPVVPIVIEIRVVVSSLGSWHAPFDGVGVASVGLFVFYDDCEMQTESTQRATIGLCMCEVSTQTAIR